MRIYLLLPALAFAALLGFSAGGVQAGRFFGSGGNNNDYTSQYPGASNNSFGCGPGSNCQARRSHFRHRLFHRDQGVTNDRMPANAMPGYGVPPAYGAAMEYVQTPIAQSPNFTNSVPMTTVGPAPVPAAPVVQTQPCRRCGQSGPVQATPAVQSRLVPMPAPMPQGPTTAEPPPADPPSGAPF